MTARDSILGRIRDAERHLDLPAVPVSGTRSTTSAPSMEECLQRFAREGKALGIECHVEATAADVRARLETLVGTARVLSWDLDQLPYEAGGALRNPVLGRAPREEQALAEVGVTGADLAIAETGTIALLSGPGRSRTVSLLPPSHVAVVRRDQLCFTMADAFVLLRERLRDAASCTFITGPSRTADIELTLTLGIHGPGHVAVIVGP